MRTLAVAAVFALSSVTCRNPEKRPAGTDIKAWAPFLREEFKRIGLESVLDDIERGGAVVREGDELRVYEIENDVKRDDEVYQKFLNGDKQALSVLQGHVSSAAMAASNCHPENGMNFFVQSFYMQHRLTTLEYVDPGLRSEMAKTLWNEYDGFVRHNIYIAGPERKKFEGRVVAMFHTHQNGTPPSKQDELVSNDRIELVVSYNGTDYRLYHVKDGIHDIIDSWSEPSLPR